MIHEPVVECSFLIPISRDVNLSDGGPHDPAIWDWLDDELIIRFSGRTLAPGLYEGFYIDPDTAERVPDQSRKYIVAVSESKLDELRKFATAACVLFQQKCIYLSIAGQVEFIEAQIMNHLEPYTDFRGNVVPLCELDAEELVLVKQLREFAAMKPAWTEYQNFYMPTVANFYTPRGLSRREITKTIPWRIAQDLGARIGLAEGWMRPGDYRDELNMLIHTKFKSRRAFCEATGLSEDMLCHVLAGRKNLSLGALAEALQRIGYGVHISPLPNTALPNIPLANLGPDVAADAS